MESYSRVSFCFNFLQYLFETLVQHHGSNKWRSLLQYMFVGRGRFILIKFLKIHEESKKSFRLGPQPKNSTHPKIEKVI